MFQKFIAERPPIKDRLIRQQTADFNRQVWQYEHPGQEMPQEDDEDGDEVIMAYEKESFICPLSQSEFVQPVTSARCRHTFSRQAITAYLRQHRGGGRCPVPGCDQQIQQSELKPDKAVERRMARLQFTQPMHDDQDEYVAVVSSMATQQ